MIRKLVFAAFLVGAASAHAAVTQIDSQSTFSSLGTITQNTVFTPTNSGYYYPDTPYTFGDITVASTQNIIFAPLSNYSNTRTILINNYWSPLPGTIAGDHDLFGFSLGMLGNISAVTIGLTTNVGSYSFEVLSPSYVPTFIGFAAGVGEKFTSFSLTSAQGSGSAPGITDVQLGNSVVSAVPEPETYAMLLAGLGLMGFVARRRNKAK